MPNAVVAIGFPPLVAAIAISSTFFVFAALGVLALVFIATQVPETRGLSLEEFEEEFRSEHS